ncbi:MAG: LysR family transcriptional regulator [Gammaproteobacteria bacterium]|nr:LysR family transcriptional regulator [Gammaproteobacteria bacterium]
MDKFGHMRALVTVARLGSFSAAARELEVTPGMLSKQVKQLEEDLDVRLLQRTTRGVSLTDAGELYVDQAVDILQRIEDTETAVTALNSSPRGVLRVSCPPSFGTEVLTPIIAAFARDNSGIRIELGLQDIEPDVIASRLDLMFRIGALKDSSLVSKQVGSAPYMLCAAPTFVAANGRPLTVQALADFNCILDESMDAYERWSFIADGTLVAQPVSGNFASPSTAAVIEAAVAGLGIAYVPRYAVVDELARDELIEIVLENGRAMSLPVTALYSSRQFMAAKTRIFLDYFIEHVDGKTARHSIVGANSFAH